VAAAGQTVGNACVQGTVTTAGVVSGGSDTTFAGCATAIPDGMYVSVVGGADNCATVAITFAAVADIPAGSYSTGVFSAGTVSATGGTTGTINTVATCTAPGAGEYVTAACVKGSTSVTGTNTVIATCTSTIAANSFCATSCNAGTPTTAGADTVSTLFTTSGTGYAATAGSVGTNTNGACSGGVDVTWTPWATLANSYTSTAGVTGTVTATDGSLAVQGTINVQTACTGSIPDSTRFAQTSCDAGTPTTLGADTVFGTFDTNVPAGSWASVSGSQGAVTAAGVVSTAGTQVQTAVCSVAAAGQTVGNACVQGTVTTAGVVSGGSDTTFAGCADGYVQQVAGTNTCTPCSNSGAATATNFVASDGVLTATCVATGYTFAANTGAATGCATDFHQSAGNAVAGTCTACDAGQKLAAAAFSAVTECSWPPAPTSVPTGSPTLPPTDAGQTHPPTPAPTPAPVTFSTIGGDYLRGCAISDSCVEGTLCTTDANGVCTYSSQSPAATNSSCIKSLLLAGQEDWCRDKSSFLAPDFDLKTAHGNGVMTILTTMAYELSTGTDHTASSATTKLKDKLGLTNVDFTASDPLAAAATARTKSDRNQALDHIKVIMQVNGVLNSLKSVIAGAATPARRLGASRSLQTANLAKGFSDAIAASTGASVDLADTGQVGNVAFAAVQQVAPGSIDMPKITAIAKATAEVNKEVASAVEGVKLTAVASPAPPTDDTTAVSAAAVALTSLTEALGTLAVASAEVMSAQVQKLASGNITADEFTTATNVTTLKTQADTKKTQAKTAFDTALVNQATPPPTPAPTLEVKEEKTSNAGAAIGGAIGAIVGLGLLYFIYTRMCHKHDGDNKGAAYAGPATTEMQASGTTKMDQVEV
jgi:hypothetical protein